MLTPDRARKVQGACWPTPAQEQVLRACFTPPEQLDPPEFSPEYAHDPAAAVLLPLLDWRWGAEIPETLSIEARRRRLALWRQSRERLAQAAALTEALRSAEIDPVFLKGTALVARYYPDPGLRGVGDVDFMVPRARVTDAVDALARAGWSAESGLSKQAIQRQMRAGHAWQFYKKDPNGEVQMCDLHWHPVVRCYSPRVAEMFLQNSEIVASGTAAIRIPCATDLLFHAAAHGLQWSWSSPIRWIPDAWFVIRSGQVDWGRLRVLAAEANMTFRIQLALKYLKACFGMPVPAEAAEGLSGAPARQAREQALLEKPNPLGLIDAARWHAFNFQRLRPFDPVWKDSSDVSAFVSYLSVFFQTTRRRDVIGAVWDKVRGKSSGS